MFKGINTRAGNKNFRKFFVRTEIFKFCAAACAASCIMVNDKNFSFRERSDTHGSQSIFDAVRVKDYLKGLGVAYTNVDITTDRALAMELVKKTKQIGVPVTFIGDKFVVGFNEPELEALLKANGLIA